MTRKDKKLLLKDLSTRLPYDVKVKIGNNSYIVKGIDKKVNDEGDWNHCICAYGMSPVEIEFCKPYLFPMSSMTPKQKAELANLTCEISSIFETAVLEIEFYIKNHFDYRGLIEKGLAVDATGLGIY